MSQHHELHAVSAQSLSSYCTQLQNSGVSPLEMSRRLENIGRFLKWAYQKDYVLYQDYQHMKDLIAKSTSHIQQSASISATSPLSDAPKLKKPLISHSYGPTSIWPQSTTSPEPEAPHTRFKKGILRPASRFNPPVLIGLLMTMLVLSILGASIYEKFVGKTQSTFAYPSSPTFTSTRVLSFQGRLTDSLGNPIVASTNMRFRLYTVSSGGASIYDTGTCSVSPDEDGIHNVLIGQDCGAGIPSSTFTENTEIWLGATVGSDAEMTPRQQIANVPYALNAETLQGLPPGSSVSNIPVINSAGDMLIAATGPQIASTFASETFVVSSAQAVTLQSAGSGDVTLTATESGTIKFATGGSQHGVITNGGLFGFGTTGPDAKLDVLYTGGEQLRLTYTDGSVYTGLTTNSSGDLTIATTGGDYAFTDISNTLFQIKDKGVYPFINLAGKTDTGDPVSCAEGDIYYNDTDDTIKICHESNTWEALDGATATVWTDSGTTAYLTDTTDEVVIGGSSPLSSAKLSIDGDADQIQMIVQGNATQTSGLAVFEQSDGTDVLTLSNAGDLVWTGNTTIGNASGDTVTSNAAAWTFANDTTVALSGGVNGINFDSNTLSIDGTNDRIGVGTAAPDGKFQVSGASIGKALAIFNETGDQDIIVASASGATRFRVATDGTIYGGYFLDISNTAYGIDPASTSNFGGYSMKITGGALLAADSGNVGIGDQTPDAKLNILSTTEQLRLDYDDSNYMSFTVGSGGDLTLDSTGGDIIIANADVLNIGGSGTDVAYNAIGDSLAGAANVASDNDLYIEDDLEVDGTIFGSVEGTVDLNFTDGSVLFANSSGVISQDNANFFWNDSTNRLGLGDTTPDAFLDVTGTTEQLRLSYETGDTNYASFTLGSGGDLTIAPSGGDLAVTGNGDFSGGLNAASGDHFNVDSSGNIGIGTTATSGYGIRMSKTVSTASLSTSYLENKTVTYTGNPIGSFYYGNVSNLTSNTTTGGAYYINNNTNFTNSTTAWQGYSDTGYWSNQTNNVAANSAYFTGFKADTVNASTGTAQDYTGFNGATTNGSTGTISVTRNFTANISNSSSGTVTTAYQYLANSPTNASGTITTIYGLRVDDQSVGTNTTAYGIYVGNQAGASGDAIGVYIADADDYSLQLASTDGDAASGITFGTDTNLYRNGANSLHTDDALDIDGAFTTDGDVAVNGDDITSDSNLTINATGYVRIGDTASPGTANGDDDLFVEGDLEVDTLALFDGNVTLGNASGDTVTANADAWTFANDTTVALAGGVNGINFDSNTLSIDATNNRIGIGTAAPTTMLHVAGGNALIVGADNVNLKIQSVSPSDTASLLIAGQNSSTAQNWALTVPGSSDRIAFKNNWSGIESMSILASGPVGIVDTSPDAFLDITGTTTQLRLSYESTDTNYANFTLSSGGDLTIAPTGSDTNVTGNLAVSGNTSLGDASTDTVTVTGKEIINFDTASADQNGLYINTSQNTATAGTLRGLNVGANFWATSGTQTGVNGLDFTVQATGNGGTVTTMKGISAWGTVSTGATVGTFKLVDAANPSNSGTITSLSGYSIDNLTSGTNNTLILAGTSTIPSGNWGIYNTSSYSNYLAGTTGIGTAGPDAKLDVLSTTEQLRLTYTDGSAYSAFTVSSGGDLTLDPTGGDIVADANVNPNTHDTYDLGTDGARWRDLYLGPDTLHVGTSTSDEGTLKYVTSTNVLTMTNNFGDTDFGSTSDGFNFTLGGGAGDDFLVDATTLAVESDNHRVGIGTAAPDAAWLDIAAATTAKAQINLTTSAGTDVSAPGSGDLWWNGTNLYFYNGSINKDLLAAGGSGPWTDGGSYVYTTAGEVINLGGITGTAYHAISDSGTTSHSLASDDDLFVEGDFEVDTAFFTDGSTTIGDASGDTVTANAAAWTFANDTTVALSGGTDGLNFDSNTLSIDATNDRIGVGTAAPSAKIHALATTEQLRLGYDVSNYASFTTSSGGDMTVDVTGGQFLLADADTLNIGGVSALAYNAISDSGGATSHSLASDDDLFVEGDVEVNGSLFADGETVLTTVSGAGLSDCDSSTSILLWDSTSKQFSCGKDNDVITLASWTKVNVVASLTNSQLDRPSPTHLNSTTSEMYMPYAGNVVGISVAGNAARTAGSATFTVFKNDSTTGFTCVIDGTNTQYNRCTQASGSDTFSAGDYLDVRVTTDLAFSPTGSTEYVAEIWIEMDTGADVAELYNVKDGTIRSADIVSIDPTLTDGVMKSTGKYDASVLGVIATKPGVLLGQNDVPDIGASRAVALTGRVPVKVTSENGPIHIGDSIAASSLPGVGMKSTQPARVVGRALGEWTNPDPHAVGSIMMFVEPGYDAGYILTQVQNLLKDTQKSIMSDFMSVKEVLAENLTASKATIVNLTTSVIRADKATLTDAQIENLNAQALKAQKIETESLQANHISSDTLETHDISADTIVANNIDTKNVRELKERLESLAKTRSTSTIDTEELHKQVTDIQEYIRKLTDEQTPSEIAETDTYQIAPTDVAIDPGTTTTALGDTVMSAQLETLTVTGAAQMSQLAVADAFSAGNVVIQNDSVLSMSDELKLSALTRVDIMNGGVVITADGSITAKGEVIAQKGVRTNTIKPLPDGKDVSVVLDAHQQSASASGEFSIENEGGTRVASIDAKGTARFNNLALNTYHEATNSAVVISAKDTYRQNGIYAPSIKTHGASSGNGIMPSGENDIIIFTDTITPKSIVNLTATSSTQNKSLFVDLVEPCTSTDNQLCQPYFRVALDDEVDTDVTFNWLIVN